MGLLHDGILDSSITASSCLDAYSCVTRSRLNTMATKMYRGAWLPRVADENQWIQTFSGNFDTSTPVANEFSPPFVARFVRLEPQTWHNYIALRLEFYIKGPVADAIDTARPLGMMDGQIPDVFISSSSCHSKYFCTRHARLNYPSASCNNGRDYEPLRDKCCEEPEDFIANDDDSTQVTNTFHPPFTARYVRIYPVSWVERIALRFELLGVKLTNGEAMITRPLGLEDRRIADSQLSASSCWNTIQCANTARLFNEYQAWSPKKTDKNPWIQVDLRQSFRLEAVLTQGRDNADNWIQTFLVTYSLDGYSWTYSLGNDGQPQIFHSNQDRNSLVVNPFMPAFVARFVRIEPLSWHHHISLRFELFGAGPIPVIPNTLGLEDYRIADSELQASSCNNDRHCANHARLNFAGEDEQGGTPSNSVTSSGKLPGAWIPRYNDHNQWVGVDLVEKYRVVGVITQGREDADQWVTSFAVSYSMDNEAWSFIGDCDREEKIYRGNHDRSTPIINLFETPLLARSVRVHPKRWTRHIALRLELLGNGPVAEVGIDANKLGMESGRIADTSIAASTCISDDAYCSESARLNREVGGWVPLINDFAQWIQVDLMAVYRVTGVITQGRSDAPHWVTRFTVWTSREGKGKWTPVTESTCGEVKEIKIFTGNCDQSTHFTNRFSPPILARYILLAPVAWHAHIALRFELLGEGPFMLPDIAVH
eukprot:XP_785592.3 PREDICTED: uncharacterized protein LOC580443 [Strongylocentrotus purpuratus]